MRVLIHLILMTSFLWQILGLSPLLFDKDDVSNASIASAYKIASQPSPFLHVRVSSQILSQSDIQFSIISANQVRINGHLFDLVSLGIFKDFIDLRINLNDSNGLQDLTLLTKNMLPEKGGLKTSSAQQILQFTPPIILAINYANNTLYNHHIWPVFVEDLAMGFVDVSRQPPQI